MATSGTVSQTTIKVIDLIDHSVLRCGIEPAKITSQMLDIAKRNLYLYLSYLSNEGINLWTIEKTLYGLTPYKTIYDLPVGTIDVLNVNYRTISRPSGVEEILSSSVSTYFDSKTLITHVGVKFGTTQTRDLIWEYSDDDITYTTVYAPGSKTYTAGEWYLYDLVIPNSAYYFRVREAASLSIDVSDHIFGNTPTEIPMSRLNRDEYVSIPNKSSTSLYPTQFWYNRILTQPQLMIWPNPTNTYIQLVVWRHRQIQDVGDLTNEVEIPQRWYECVLANLSARNALDIPGVASDRILLLGKAAESAQQPPSNEERDKSPIYATPPIGAYTRRLR